RRRPRRELHRRRRGHRRAPRRAAQRGRAPPRQGHRRLRLLHLADRLPRAADAAPARRLPARLPRRRHCAQAHRAHLRALRAREDPRLHPLARRQRRAGNRARHPRRGEPAREVDRDLPRQPAPHPRRRLRGADPARDQRRERLHQPRRDRRQHRPGPRLARSDGRPVKRSLPSFALVVLAAAAVELFALHWLMPFENRLLDSFVKAHATALAPDPDIVLVDIDESSLARMEQGDAGRWPWPRVVYADLIEGLAAQKPRAIVFDMMFVERDRFRPQDDAAFAESVTRHPNTYFAFLRLPESSDSKGVRIGEFAGDFGLIRSKSADPQAKIALVPPLVLPKETYARAGLITFKDDPDGVGRRYLLRETFAGWHIPSLPARVAYDLGYPVPDQDSLVLAWRGAANSFARVSFADLYEEFNRLAKKRPANEFAGKIVIIGTAATGMHDLRVTPMHPLHPGAEILGTAIENLKNGRHMEYAPAWWSAALGLALLAGLYFAFRRGVEIRATGAALALLSALLIGAEWTLVGRFILWPLLTPLAAAWTLYAAAALSEYLRARREREAAMAQFSRFTNPHVARQLVELGGIETGRREVTLLFSDIRNFTTLSETRKPEEVIALLNRYFSLQV